MEMEQFDDLTRHLGGDWSLPTPCVAGARGGVLLGGTFAGVAARLGLADVAAVKAKKPRRGGSTSGTSQAERKAQGQLHAEGGEG